MGGKGAGRLNVTDSILKKATENKTTPASNSDTIGGDFILPNHSGIASHPEAKKEFEKYIKIDGSSVTTAEIPFAEGLSLPDDKHLYIGDDDNFDFFFDSISNFVWIGGGTNDNPSIVYFKGVTGALDANQTGGHVYLKAGSGSGRGATGTPQKGGDLYLEGGNGGANFGGTGGSGGDTIIMGGSGISGGADGIIKTNDSASSTHSLNAKEDVLIAGKLEVNGLTYFDDRISVKAGSVSDVAITFNDDQDTGFYSAANESINISIAGVNRGHLGYPTCSYNTNWGIDNGNYLYFRNVNNKIWSDTSTSITIQSDLTQFGSDASGGDVKFFGATSAYHAIWDESLNQLRIEAGDKMFVCKDLRARTQNNVISEWQDLNGNMLMQLAYAPTTEKDIEIRFGDDENTKIGFPELGYFAFINDVTEFWLGTTGDDTLYFNYYVGSGESHGTATNTQTVDYYCDKFHVRGNNANRRITITPNTTIANPVDIGFGAQSTGVRIGTSTDYTFISKTGDVNFGGTGGFYPRRVSQSAEPTNGTGSTQIDVGEMIIWRNPDDNKTYFMYNDTDEGVRKVEMT